MAFQAMVNGADCGPSNPLQNLLKHVERDSQSARLDSFAQAGPSRFQQPGLSINNRSEAEDVQQFLNPSSRSPYGMGALMEELDAARQAAAATPSARQGLIRLL